jgi:hypothetical protein
VAVREVRSPRLDFRVRRRRRVSGIRRTQAHGDDARHLIRIDSDFYDEVLPGLAAGRRDLIAAIEGRHREWTRYKRWHSGGGVRGRVRRLLRLA